MTQRTKLELPINKPVEIELLYDEPITGKSQYGDYYMYAVKCNGEEYTFFAPEEVHEKLKNLSKGDKAVITKLAAQRGSKLAVTYEVIKEENQEVEEERKSDSLYELLLKSYRDALEIQKELNGMIDIEKAAITLFIARSKINGHIE